MSVCDDLPQKEIHAKSVVWVPKGALRLAEIVKVKSASDRQLALLDHEVATVTLDLSGHPEMDGAGLQWLLALQSDLQRRGVTLQLSGLGQTMRGILTRVHLMGVFPIC